MLTIITLAGLLTSPLYAANGYSPSERRTLQTALEMALQHAELDRFQQLCLEQQPASAVAKAYPANPINIQQHQALLAQKVKISDLTALVLVDSKLTQFVKRNVTNLTDCDNDQAYQALIDSYELTQFSLEIATDLKQAPISADLNKQRLIAKQSADIKQLISRSYTIALVTISDKQLLNAVEQANHLHLNYNSQYIFKVNQGWKNITAPYMGMHIALDEDSFLKTTSEWLIFLDQNKHFIQAIKKQDAALHLRLLTKPDWMFDDKGNLVRLD